MSSDVSTLLKYCIHMFQNLTNQYFRYISKIDVKITFTICTIRNNMLLFNENHNNEVHVKIGGDHGGGSFKMSYQIANVTNPNSKDNTLVFSLFEAKDYRINMKTGLSRFGQQIDELRSMMWRLSTKFYLMINIFMNSK